MLQEGLSIELLHRVVRSLADTAREAGVTVVAGDTKVVEGNGGLIINTAGVGFVPENVFLERLPEIAKNAIADACTGSNPRQPSQEEMEKLLTCCYYDTEVDF